MVCSVEGCEEPKKYKGMCKRHYSKDYAAKRRGGYVKVGDFCKKGHKIEDSNAQFYMNHGVERVRCRLCNEKANNTLKIGDTCKWGHVVAGDNLMRIKKDGFEFFRCRKCNSRSNSTRLQRAIANGTVDEYRRKENERARQRRLKRQLNSEHNGELKEIKDIDRLLSKEVKAGSATFNSLKYLKLGKRAGQASQALEAAFDNARAKCYANPGPYIDYEDGQEPRPIDAYRLCEGCPLLVECGRFAAAYHPPVGVWGGEVYVGGKVVK